MPASQLSIHAGRRFDHAPPAAFHRPAALACSLAALAALSFAAPVYAQAASMTPTPPALGAHTLLVQSDGKGLSPAISQPLDTGPAGSSLLVVAGGYTDNDSVPTDTYGNHWQPVGNRVLFRGYKGRFYARAFVALDAKGGNDHRISVDKPGHPKGEITTPFVEIRHAGVLQAVAQNYPEPGAIATYAVKANRAWHRLLGTPPTFGATITSGKVTTTGPATLVAVWWGDGMTLKMTAVPNHGFKVIDQYLDLPPNSGVQAAVAVRQVDGPGTWDVSWTGTPAQGAILWLFAFQAKP